MDNITILVVDDEERMRKLIKDFLNAKGYKILEAEDGEKALEIFELNKEKIDLNYLYDNILKEHKKILEIEDKLEEKMKNAQ